MIRYVYSRWDGAQRGDAPDANLALEALSRWMMEGLSAQEALDWLRRDGFEPAGLSMRVMGIEELVSELRERARQTLSRFHMDEAFGAHGRRLRELLGVEERAVAERHGVESAQWNDFMQRSSELPEALSGALERLRDYRWVDAEAERAYRELLEDLEDARRLEAFAARNRRELRGDEALDFEAARELMEELEALSRWVRALLEGDLEAMDPDALRERLGDEAAHSLIWLRGIEGTLAGAGYLGEGDDGEAQLTPRAVRRIGERALEDIYGALSRGPRGAHETCQLGPGGPGTPSAESTRPHAFGQTAQLDSVGSVRNALRRRPPGPGRAGPAGVRIAPEDLQVFETERSIQTTTVLLLDMSWSMSWSGRWPAAKRVALAMDHLIRTHYPRDRLFIVGFYTRARELRVHELAELAWNASDPFTNLQDGLRVAQRLIERHPSSGAQILVITDGQPTAYFRGEELHVEWPAGRGGLSPTAVRETLGEVRRVTRKDITINTFMLDDAPELLSFVEAMTRINRGRAFYTTPDQIGRYVMVDYLSRKRRRAG